MERVRRFLRQLSLPSNAAQHVEPDINLPPQQQPQQQQQQQQQLLFFANDDEIADYIRRTWSRDKIQQLLDSMRSTQPADKVAELAMNRTRALQQLSTAHELVYALGKKVVEDCVLSHLSVPGDLAKSAEAAKPTLKNMKKNHQLFKNQYDIIFPESGGEIDLEKIDITLWAKLAETVTAPEDRGTWIPHINCIRSARNKLAHMTQGTDVIMDFDLEEFLEQTRTAAALQGLGVGADQMAEIRQKKGVSSYLKFNPEDMIIKHSDPVYGEVRLMPRAGWKAVEPCDVRSSLRTPVENVVITHTVQHNCILTSMCCQNAWELQFSDMNGRKFSDISVNFLVGNDGVIYEGRGTDYEGAYAKGWNHLSFGFAFIGTYDDVTLPSNEALDALCVFLRFLVASGKLRTDYKLYALRQIRPFPNAPGNALFQVLKSWPHWTEFHGTIPEITAS